MASAQQQLGTSWQLDFTTTCDEPQAAELSAALSAARGAVAAREGEIARLGARLGTGPDVDRLALERRAGERDEIVLALNKQVRGGQGPLLQHTV